MKIFVGSINPVKLNAVINAAGQNWPTVEVVGLEVISGIADQPIGDELTRQGAENRARAAFQLGAKRLSSTFSKKKYSLTALGIGLEGGVIDLGQEMWSTVWGVVVADTGNVFAANGAKFLVPPRVADQIRGGGEMGPIMEKIMGEKDVRSKQGLIGVITQGFVDRTQEYTAIAKLALGLWYGRHWSTGLIDC